MPNFSLSCDVDQGYNFRKDKSVPVGFITAITIGDKALTADTTVKDPMNPTTDLKVVAVVSDVSWGVGVTDTIYFSGQITTANRQEVAMLAYLDLTKVEVLFIFNIYNYDPAAKKYFKCLQVSDTQMKGLLEKNGSDLNLQVADEPSNQVQSPLNYAFSIGIKPQPTAQTITVATADQKNVVKAWGITVS